MKYNPTKAGCMVNACCVLHNYCLVRGVPNPRPIFEDLGEVFEVVQDDNMNIRQLAERERQFLVDFAYERRHIGHPVIDIF